MSIWSSLCSLPLIPKWLVVAHAHQVHSDNSHLINTQYVYVWILFIAYIGYRQYMHSPLIQFSFVHDYVKYHALQNEDEPNLPISCEASIWTQFLNPTTHLLFKCAQYARQYTPYKASRMPNSLLANRRKINTMAQYARMEHHFTCNIVQHG